MWVTSAYVKTSILGNLSILDVVKKDAEQVRLIDTQQTVVRWTQPPSDPNARLVHAAPSIGLARLG